MSSMNVQPVVNHPQHILLYGLKVVQCEGYDITKLQDHFRLLLKLKGRDGESNIRTPLYFDGACNIFKELPTPNDPEIHAVYERVRQIYNS